MVHSTKLFAPLLSRGDSDKLSFRPNATPAIVSSSLKTTALVFVCKTSFKANVITGS